MWKMNGPDGWCGQQTAVPEGTLDSRRVFEGVFHSRKGKGKAGQIFLAAQPTAGIRFFLERRSFQVKRLNIWSNLKMPRKVKITYAHQLTGQVLLSAPCQPRKMTYLTSFNKLLGLYPRLRCCGVHCSAPPPLTWLPFSSPRRAVTAVEKSSGWAAQGGQRRTLNSGFSSGHHQCQSGRRAAWSVRLFF